MHRQLFSSRLGTILTMIGVAVGLGNVWRFPYMMGSYGGSAFLLMYLLFTLMFAFPALMTEIALGKKSRKGTVHALRMILGEKAGGAGGYLLLAVVTIAGSYYAVIVSNVLFSALFSAFKGYSAANNSLYTDLLSNGLLQYAFTLGLIVLSLFIIHLGLRNGVERISKIIIPFFGLSIIYLIVYSITLPGATDKLIEFLKPDINAIGSSEIFAALGQAFFSLGLGGTFVVVYSGYMNAHESIPKTALLTSLGDLGSSVLVSLFLVPCILLFGLEMNSGPSLIFNTFPELFSTMPAGRFVGTLFLFSLSFVAFLSLIAAYQVPVRSIEEIKPTISRKKLIIGLGIIQAVLAFPSSLWPAIIGPLDLIFGSGMQVIGSLLIIMGVWWGHSNLDFMKNLTDNKTIGRFLLFWIRWVIPLTLLTVLVVYIIDSLR